MELSRKFFLKSIGAFFLVFVLFFQAGISFQETSVNFSLSPEIAYAQDRDNTPAPAPTSQGDITINPSDRFEGLCSFTSPRTWLTICWSEPLYNVSNTLLIMAGAVFDYMLDFTLDTCILANDGIRDIWTDMRDIANMGFILGLIFISFSLITGAAAARAKSLFVRLIIIALVLNFSLFVSKVIIDAGNITALTFYNGITTTATPFNYDELQGTKISETKNNLTASCKKSDATPKSISGALVGLFNPARIFDSKNFESLSRAEARNQSSILMAMFIGGTVINVLMAKEVFLAGFLFISRTMWLIILMVISPLAFVSYFLPGQDYLKKWFNMIVNRSFCVVVYLFFLWLIIKITQGLFTTIFTGLGTSSQQSWSTAFILVVIQFAIVFGVLKIANKTAMKMCDDGSGMGAALQSVGKKAVGLGVGVATGGAGLAARTTIGRFGYKALEARAGDPSRAAATGRKLTEMQSQGGFRGLVGTVGLNTFDSIANSKLGTNNSYRAKATTISSNDLKEADRMARIRTNTYKAEAQDPETKKKLVETYMRDGKMTQEQASQKADKEVKKTIKQAGAMGKADADEWLASRVISDKGAIREKAKEQGVDLANMSKGAKEVWLEQNGFNKTDLNNVGGIAKVVWDRGVAGAPEALDKFRGRDKDDKEKRVKQKELADFANNASAQRNAEAGEIERGAARTIADVTSKMFMPGVGAKDIFNDKSKAAQFGAIMKAAFQSNKTDADGNVTVDKDGNIIREITEQNAKRYESATKDIQNEMESVVSSARDNDAEINNINQEIAGLLEDVSRFERTTNPDGTDAGFKADTPDQKAKLDRMDVLMKKQGDTRGVSDLSTNMSLDSYLEQARTRLDGATTKAIDANRLAAENDIANIVNSSARTATGNLKSQAETTRRMSQSQYESVVVTEISRRQEDTKDKLRSDANIGTEADGDINTGVEV